MTFSDLPPGWAERPITDPDLFEDVVDLIATEQSRESGCLYVLICDDAGRMVQPVAFDTFPFDDSRPRQDEHVATLCGILRHAGVRRIAVVIARPGHPAPTGNDRQLRAALQAGARRRGIEIVAGAVATPLGVAAWPEHGSVVPIAPSVPWSA